MNPILPVVTELLDSYFMNKIDFSVLIESIDFTKFDVLFFKNFTKSKKIDDLIG